MRRIRWKRRQGPSQLIASAKKVAFGRNFEKVNELWQRRDLQDICNEIGRLFANKRILRAYSGPPRNDFLVVGLLLSRNAVLHEPLLQFAQTFRPVLTVDVEVGPDDDRNASAQFFDAQGQDEVVALRVVSSLNLL